MEIDEKTLNEVIAQLEPTVKNSSTNLRMRIAQHARYHSNRPNTPYGVTWDGQTFNSDDTGELVDQVIVWLKKPIKERATAILIRQGYEG